MREIPTPGRAAWTELVEVFTRSQDNFLSCIPARVTWTELVEVFT